ncbi:hypothetical protein [Mesorhizobium sp. 131-2-1]|nr:hypothetical protein [Mesorhizobium sp. 131-2-1]
MNEAVTTTGRWCDPHLRAKRRIERGAAACQEALGHGFETASGQPAAI